MAIMAVGSAVMQGMAAASQAQQQKNIAEYNATALNQEAKQASAAGAANEAEEIRKDQGLLGEQAAGFAGANIGTGGSVRTVEKQSATNARMNELNTWYQGELESSSLKNQANFQQWQANQIKPTQEGILSGMGDAIGSGGRIGTSMLMSRGVGYGSSGSTSTNFIPLLGNSMGF
jgi:hypothetical protein